MPPHDAQACDSLHSGGGVSGSVLNYRLAFAKSLLNYSAVNILIATSEAVPFAKTGGLADVCGALPQALARLGHNISVIMPGYRQVTAAAADRQWSLEETSSEFGVPVGQNCITGHLQQTVVDGVRYYFVQQPEYFDRPGLYGEDGVDYRDNCERFVFFSRAVLEAVRSINPPIDLIHCNDWQTSLIPVFIDAEYRVARGYESLSTLLTIHNLAYQGRFWHWDMLLTGLDWRYFQWRRLEFYGGLNLLKGGIVYADAINTVSPTYAEEIQTPELGCGLEGVLHQRRHQLTGILNGVDYNDWNPAHDALLPKTYDAQSWQMGKSTCKAHLQQTLGLTVDPRIPILGFVGRIVEQKGVGLIAEVMKSWANHENVQWVILGTGDQELETQITELATTCPHRVAAKIEFSNEMAHQIEAASDIFLMPSRYEPCGLNQLYSLKYGSVPLVHSTGGLSDTIVNCTDETLQHKTATGFTFDEYHLAAFEATLKRAVDLYNSQPQLWQQIVQTGMNQDWSWNQSARSYANLYQRTIHHVREPIQN